MGGITERDKMDILDRFLRYVVINTQSNENSNTMPSTEGQKVLGALLVEELKEVGCEDAVMDEWGYVYGSIEDNIPQGHSAFGRVPPLGLIAHLDTYFGTKGEGVKPQVIRNYQGGDIPLTGIPNEAIKVQEHPNLMHCIGHTIITSNGETLLGADDKAGIAIIMSTLGYLKEHPDFKHGKVCIAFTPDEEVGRGTEKFNISRFGAKYAYTVDGADLGEIEDETFCADRAVVVVKGKDVHPGYAKGKMINAVRVMSEIIMRAPKGLLPETTEGRQPYLHPYEAKGDVNRAEIKFLLRAFTEEELREREKDLRSAVEEVKAMFGGVEISVEVVEQYRNMLYKLKETPEVIDFAMEAMRRIGIEPKRKAIRGGTDGARLTFMGIPTPNLWAGGQAFHSIYEWVSLEWMALSMATILELLNVWVEKA